MDEAVTEQFKPPYLPFATFWSFIKFLAERPLPPRVDRSLMNGRSGSDQAGLFAALKSFGLVDEDNRVQQLLSDLASTDEEQRKRVLAEMIRKFYPEPMAVSQANGTEQQLREVFRDTYGLSADETRRKSMTFFLHALREADLPVSANFPATRAGSGAPGVPRAKPSARRGKGSRSKVASSATSATTAEPRAPGDSYAVELRSGGTVRVEVTVNLFALSRQDREFVIDLVDKLKTYEEQKPTVLSATE